MSLRIWQELFGSVLDNLSEGVFVVDHRQRLRMWNSGAARLAAPIELTAGRRLPCRELQLCPPENAASPRSHECPVALTLADGRTRETAVTFRDGSGRRLPGSLRTAPLTSRNGAVVGAVLSVRASTTSSWALSRIAELEEMANVDPLTEVANRRVTELQLRRSLAELLRFRWRFGVVVLDVDDLKLTNDTYGHRVGDEVLRFVARTLSGNSRPFDVVGRWGGDEFVVLIKNVDEEQLAFVARKLAAAVARTPVPYSGERPLLVSVSAGEAVARSDDTVESLVTRADLQMYQKKIRNHAHAAPARRDAATAPPLAHGQD